MSAPATQTVWTEHDLRPALVKPEEGRVEARVSDASLFFDWHTPAVVRSARSHAESISAGVAKTFKRGLDVTGASLLLLIAAPIMVLVALVILADSRGPILYRTYRVGHRGRLFRFYKFRTMVCTAENLLDQVRDLNEREKILFKVSHDPRLTRVGGFLRKYSLDELPQLWNILKGDMSLVG